MQAGVASKGHEGILLHCHACAVDGVDGLQVFVWPNAAINAGDLAADAINPNSRLLSKVRDVNLERADRVGVEKPVIVDRASRKRSREDMESDDRTGIDLVRGNGIMGPMEYAV